MLAHRMGTCRQHDAPNERASSTKVFLAEIAKILQFRRLGRESDMRQEEWDCGSMKSSASLHNRRQV